VEFIARDDGESKRGHHEKGEARKRFLKH